MKERLFLKIFDIFLVGAMLLSCQSNGKQQENGMNIIDTVPTISEEPKIIIDSEFSFEEAIAGSEAPQHILDQLILLNVKYLSTDGKIHQGQMLVNQKIASDVEHIFKFMLEHEFHIHQAVPIVKYNWDDNLSMAANNSTGFCYRNVMNTKRKSKHSTGMAIDINPFFNPIRWKTPNKHRPNIPVGAVLDTTVNGTLYPGHPVVEEMKHLGFRWGNQFRRYWDDHHFDK